MKNIRSYIAKRLFKEKTGMTKVIPNKKKNKIFEDHFEEESLEKEDEEKNE